MAFELNIAGILTGFFWKKPEETLGFKDFMDALERTPLHVVSTERDRIAFLDVVEGNLAEDSNIITLSQAKSAIIVAITHLYENEIRRGEREREHLPQAHHTGNTAAVIAGTAFYIAQTAIAARNIPVVAESAPQLPNNVISLDSRRP